MVGWVLNHEAIEYELQDRPYLFTIRASCGLNRLRNIDFMQDNGETYQGKKTLAGIVARCLNKIPTADFWNGSEDQLKEVVDIFNASHADADFTSTEGAEFLTTVLEQTLTRAEAFYKTNSEREDDFGRRAHYPENFNSCFDVLEHITTPSARACTKTPSRGGSSRRTPLNWSTSLKVQKWTRTQVSSESLGRVLSGSTYVPKASSESVTFKQDLETNHALGEGWTNSYLLPVKRCPLTHLKAGQRSVFGNPRFFYIDYPSAGGPTFVNSDMELSEGQTLHLTGLYDTGDLVREYGSVITNAAFNDHGVNRIGARVILRFKVKVGNQYYGSEFSMDSENTDIDMPTGYNGDFTDPNLSFNEVNLPNPSWSTNEKWFDVVVPWTNANPEPAIQSDGNGWNRVGGFHIKDTDDNQFEYRVNETQDRRFEQPSTSPRHHSPTTRPRTRVSRLPWNELSSHGREPFFKPSTTSKKSSPPWRPFNTTTTETTSPQTSKTRPRTSCPGFRVGVDSDDEDGDVEYFVEQNENTEYLDLGETLIGVSETQGGLPNASGALYTFVSSASQTSTLTGDTWHSITDTVDQDEDPSHNLVVAAREALYMRGKPLPVQRGEVVSKYGTSNTTAPLDMTTAWAHNCSTVGDVEDVLVPLSVGFTAGTGVYSFEGALLSRTVLSFEPYVEPVRGGSSGGGGGGPVGPVNQGKASTSNQFTDLLDQVGGVEEAVDDISTKTDLITVTGAVNLDTVNTKVGHLTVTQAVDLDAVETAVNTNATNIREAQEVTDLISTNSGNTAITNIVASTNVLRADAILVDSNRTFVTDAQKLQIASNELQISGNTSSVMTNAGAIGDIEDKTDLLSVTGQTNLDTVRNKTDAITINPAKQITALSVTGTPLDADNISQNGTNKFTTAALNTKLGFISVTQAVDLDTLEQDVDDIAVAIDLDNNGDAARTHAGAEVALWNNNGVLESVADGSAGQYLKTDGSGRYSWGSPRVAVGLLPLRTPLSRPRVALPCTSRGSSTTAPPRTVGTSTTRRRATPRPHRSHRSTTNTRTRESFSPPRVRS